MVPDKQEEIPQALAKSVEHLLDRLRRDRESLAQSGYGEASEAAARLNALADEADKLRVALSRPCQGCESK